MAKSKRIETGKSAASVFKAIDDLLRTPGGNCNTSIDYMEQTSWLLFLRYLDAKEPERREEAVLRGEHYTPALPKEYAWSTWAYPTKPDGSFDFDKALKGEDLLAFVKNTLFPGLKELRDKAPSTQSIQYRIGGIFSGLRCLFESGHTLRDVIDLIQPLSFETEEDRHEMTMLYEERLADMGNAGRNGGQYYTPRPLIRTMVRILDPKLGETFYDGACGSGGFICEGFAYMRDRAGSKAGAWEKLQRETFYGQEVKSIPYVTAQMNCILHGLETPNIAFGDTLKIKVADFTDADRVDVIAANPPFGAKVDETARQNFVTRSGESAYLFMEHFVEKLHDGGRAAIIIKNTVLSNTDNASVYVRKMLVEKCQLEWILDLPQKVFAAGVKAVVLFFRKGGPTEKPINYYELDLGDVSLGKTRPLKEEDLAEFEALAKGGKKTTKAHWTIDPSKIDHTTYDLSVKNPNREKAKAMPVAECEAELQSAFRAINKLAGMGLAAKKTDTATQNNDASRWPTVRLGDVCAGRVPRLKTISTSEIDYIDISSVDRQSKSIVSTTRYGIDSAPGRAQQVVQTDDVLVSTVRPNLNAVAIVPEPYSKIPRIASTGFSVLRCKDELYHKWLYYYSQTENFIVPLVADSEKAAYPSVTDDRVRDSMIPLPPLAEQKKIVAKLEKDLARVKRILATAQDIKNTCEKLRKAILSESFQ